MKMNIIPLILYWGFLIILVYTTGISVEPLAIVFPLGIFAASVWCIIPFFIGKQCAKKAHCKFR